MASVHGATARPKLILIAEIATRDAGLHPPDTQEGFRDAQALILGEVVDSRIQMPRERQQRVRFP